MIDQPAKLSFAEDDAFGWENFADRLKDFLRVETHFVDGSLVVSLDAPFGSGKTTFLSMWKSRLDREREGDSAAPVCVLLNAWEDDYCGDPLLSLVHAINAEMVQRSPTSQTKRNIKALKEAAKDVCNFGLGMANSFVSGATRIDPEAVGEFAARRKARRNGADSKVDILQLYGARREALGRLKTALQGLIERVEAPVFVLVDELDRCRPDFAIQYLETIKHLFDIKGLTFILAIDAGQLQNSAKALFGHDLVFDEYYRKFAHWRVTLPKPDLKGIRNLVTRYTEKYLNDPAESGARRKSMLDLAGARAELVELSLHWGLGPRQIQEAFRIVGHLTAAKSAEGEPERHFPSIFAITIFLAFLSVGRPEQFRKIATDKMSPSELLDLVVEGFSDDRRKWWALFLVAMLIKRDDWEIGGSSPSQESILAEFIQRGLISEDTTVEQFRQTIGNHSMNFDRGSQTLRSVAKRIVEVERFAS